jgi:thiol-disulfide isomerase/thioredoxin
MRYIPTMTEPGISQRLNSGAMCSRNMLRQAAVVLILMWFAGQVQAAGLEPYESLLPQAALSLEDLGGNTHNLNDYRGQVVLVNFWATWCPPCIVEMPALQRLKQKLAGKPFRILAVNEKESEETIWKFHKLVKVDFPLLLDRDGQASEDWHVAVYPSSYLVDAAGEIRYQVTGMLEWDAPEVVEVIEALMGEDIRDREPAGAPPPAR